jgi:hypothetical protein
VVKRCQNTAHAANPTLVSAKYQDWEPDRQNNSVRIPFFDLKSAERLVCRRVGDISTHLAGHTPISSGSVGIKPLHVPSYAATSGLL